MSIRERIAIRLNRLADTVAAFPGNVVAALKTAPETLAHRIRKTAQAACGCHHETAAGCALYRKDGPDRCACACHPRETPRVRTYTFTTSVTTSAAPGGAKVFDSIRTARGQG